MSTHDLRVGLIGAGYIASWHAGAIKRVPGVRLAAVCDLSRAAAEGAAAAAGADHVFTDAKEMLSSGEVDAVHVLTPPDSHAGIARACLEAGLPVLVEKPFVLDPEEGAALSALAAERNLALAVNHNFLGLPSYERLKAAAQDGTIGPIDSVEANWRFPLTPLRSGPFGLWMLREPKNLLFELGPHLFAFVHDLLGPLENPQVRLAKPIEVPGGITHHQHWQVLGRAGTAEVTLNLSLVEGHDDRSLTVRGATGLGRLDYAADTLEIRRANTDDIVVSPLKDSLSVAGQHLAEGLRNAVRQTKSLNAAQPYALGIEGAVRAFYEAVRSGAPVDPRFSGETGTAVIRAVAEAAEAAAPQLQPKAAPAASAADEPGEGADALVIGGTGFIGRYLVEALARQGKRVRVLSRGRPTVFDHLSGVHAVQASLGDEAALARAMEGVPLVYHLAKATESSWEGYLKNDVEPTERLGRAALRAGVERFVYTGTIDSYDASRSGTTISEETGADPQLEQRNLYARSKATCEEVLMRMHEEEGLPLVIVRPGIVIGRGGPLQHWGIGRWQGAGAVKIWGKGENVLPFVLVDDCADGLVLAGTKPGIEGQSFNLIGEPMLSARGYFDTIKERTGAGINVAPGSIPAYYVSDVAKYVLKRYAAGMRDAKKPAFRDWKSRTQAASFSNERAKDVLGWQPEADREAFLRRAIDEANLFGF